MIELDDSHYIGEGNYRICFAHPTDKNKVIKVPKHAKARYKDQNSRERHRDQNRIEYSFMKHFHGDASQLARCYGWVRTNKGKGLVFDRIKNYDGTPSETLESAVKNNRLPLKTQQALFRELQQYDFNNRVLLSDAGMSNLMVQYTAPNQPQLVFIDGIGSKKYGLRFLMRQKFWSLGQLKSRKAWKAFQESYKELQKEVKA